MDELTSLIDLFDELEKRGTEPALVGMTQDGRREWSCEQLMDRVRRGSRGLRGKGLDPGDRVILFSEPCMEWIAAALAVVRVGGVPVPVDVQMEASNRSHVLKDAGARLIVTTSDHRNLFAGHSDVSLILLDGTDQEPNSWHQWERKGDASSSHSPESSSETAALFYTSGTTGEPKGVPLTHRNLCFELNALREENLIEPSDRILLPLPFHHVYPVVIGILAPLVLRVPIILPHTLTGPELIRALREEQASVILGVPRLYRAIQENIASQIQELPPGVSGAVHSLLGLCRWTRQNFGWNLGESLLGRLHRKVGPELRMLVSGGSSLSSDLAYFLEGLGWDVATGYGLTETSPILTLNRPDEKNLDSAGQTLPGVELDIDPSGTDPEKPVEETGKTTPGEVLARGPNVFSGYWNLPEVTREVLDGDGWFHTGDLGYFDSEGYLHLEGRLSTLIVTEGGENVQPDEVEAAYEQHPMIEEIGIFERAGRLVGLIVPDLETIRDAGEGSVETALRAAVRQRARDLPSYWQLNELAFTNTSLPRTRLGDLRRHRLPERFDQATYGGDDSEAGKGAPLEIEDMDPEDRELAQTAPADRVWSLLVDRYEDRNLRPGSNLQMDLGIDSLEWVNLTLLIQQRTEVVLDDDAIERVETVRELLQTVVDQAEKSRQERPADSTPFSRPELYLDREQKRWITSLPRWLRPLQRVLHALNSGLIRTGLTVSLHQQQDFPESPFVLASNHLSHLDPFVLAAVLPYSIIRRTYWGAWTGQAFTNPLTRSFSRLAQALPIDPVGGKLANLAYGAAVLQQENNLVWFPEGRRSPDGTLQPFQPGLGHLLHHFDVPVLPTRIDGTDRVLPPGQRLPRSGSVEVRIGRTRQASDWVDVNRDEDPGKQITAGLRTEIQKLVENG